MGFIVTETCVMLPPTKNLRGMVDGADGSESEGGRERTGNDFERVVTDSRERVPRGLRDISDMRPL